MLYRYFLLCLFGISACFVSGTIARVAIVGGSKASPHQFPYQVVVMVHPGPHMCGGGILNDNFVLSAAHCFINEHNKLNAQAVTVLAGTIDLYVTVSESTPFVKVSKIYIPHEYAPPINKAIGDIAVLRLKYPLNLHKNTHLHPLRLPEDHHHQETYSRKTGHIAGFGLQYMEIKDGKEVGGYHDNFLRYALADVLSTYQCKSDHPDREITDKHLCARVQQHKNKQNGVCTGDSGGPLVLDHHTVIGILSASPFGCSEHLQSGVYTKVVSYVPFIKNAMSAQPTNVRELDVRS